MLVPHFVFSLLQRLTCPNYILKVQLRMLLAMICVMIRFSAQEMHFLIIIIILIIIYYKDSYYKDITVEFV